MRGHSAQNRSLQTNEAIHKGETITNVEIIRAGGTAAVTFGSKTVEELATQFRPAILAAT